MDILELTLCACGCGQRVRYDKYRSNKYINGHNKRTRPAEYYTQELPLCLCGCGQLVKYRGNRYISGHNSRVEHFPKVITKEHRTNLSISHKGKKNPFYPKNRKSHVCSEETKTKIRIKRLERLRNDPEFAKKMGAAWQLHPNKPELKLQSILDNYFPNQWRYTGDGSLVIGGKIPDFSNINGKKALIEVYGTYWHRNDNPQDRIDHFSEFGYFCLIIWEDELQNEEKIKEKIVGWEF